MGTRLKRNNFLHEVFFEYLFYDEFFDGRLILNVILEPYHPFTARFAHFPWLMPHIIVAHIYGA